MPTRLTIRPLPWLRPPLPRARPDISAAARVAAAAPCFLGPIREGLPMPPGRTR